MYILYYLLWLLATTGIYTNSSKPKLTLADVLYEKAIYF